jgi:hypothetical protein
MFMLVFATFFTTGSANLCAYAANVHGPVTAHAHKLCRCVTDGSTFHVQLDTACHHLYMLFLQAGGSTMVTNGRTSKTCINTALILVITCHIKFVLSDEYKAQPQRTGRHGATTLVSNHILIPATSIYPVIFPNTGMQMVPHSFYY